MKKGIVLLLVTAMAATTLLSGCSKDDGASSSGSSASSSADVSSAEEEDREVKTAELLEASDYKVKKYVKLMKDYKNLDVEVDSSYEVTDENVIATFNDLVAQYPNYIDKQTAEDGDVVNIDYEGTLNGEAFDGGTGTGYDLTLGSDTFIDGFEDGLIGVSAGDSLDLNLTFPEDYSSSEELAGQAVVFHVTVNSVKEPQTLTYDTADDDYVSENFSSYGYSTVDSLYSYCEDYTESQKDSAVQSAVLEKLVDGCTVTLPDGLLDERLDSYVENMESTASAYGLDLETYLSYYGFEDEDAYREYITEDVTTEITQSLILERIVQKEKISIQTSEFDSYVLQMIYSYYSYYGTMCSEEEIYEMLGGDEADAMLYYAETQVLEQLVDGASVTFVDGLDDATEETDDTSSDDTSADAE